MAINVLMLPHLVQMQGEAHGISRVIEAYFRYLPEYGVNLVDLGRKDYDLVAAHAGSTGGPCSICHLHGIYWTSEYEAPSWEFHINAAIVASVRQAKAVTVPSAWVAETFQRDMRFTPHIVPHGIDWQAWQHDEDNGGFVLWNKNRGDIVCDPQPVIELALRFPHVRFVTTFTPKRALVPANVSLANPTGGRKHVLPPDDMKHMVQQCGVYLATTCETFGIGILEAMASGKPVLGFARGGIVDLVQHGINGYLARPGDYDDLAGGLQYCRAHAATLGDNGREMAKVWTWQRVAEQVAGIYRSVLEPDPPTVSIVIPCYNKNGTIERAIQSAVGQNYPELIEVIVVDDGSTDNSVAKARQWVTDGGIVRVIEQENRGVAHARNAGIAAAHGKYVCCLDGDDWLEPDFLTPCVTALEKDRALGIAYTSLRWHKPDGSTGISPWPGLFEYDRQLRKQNQVPTCCLFRRVIWERLGGYRQRYAPKGAGAEDAEFWLRAGAYGFNAQKVTDQALFNYSWMSGQVSGDQNYQEVDWRYWHPWAAEHHDKEEPGHPFASLATPKRQSHPVRQYDQPVISVIVPVGPGHEKELLNVLDSLEAQTFRKWEAIVVWDTGNPEPSEWYKTPFPYVRWLYTDHKGPGYARNRGAEIARGAFVVFLDADDWLYPECLAKMMEVWVMEQAIVYTDYVGKAYIDDKDFLKKMSDEGRLRAQLRDGEVVLGHQAFDFDCERVMEQPALPPYVFCNVTALIPKAWHDAIGGFDEAMPSWEDVDYHWRHARAGHCYVRLAEELMVYRFYTGGRRDAGLQQHQKLVQYILEKYSKESPVGCNGCGKGRTRTTVGRPAPVSVPGMARGARMVTMPQQPSGGSKTVILADGNRRVVNDGDFVMARYVSPQRGDRLIVGPFSHIRYAGRHSPGDVFLVHRDDLQSPLFQEVRVEAVPLPFVAIPAAPPPAPVSVAQPQQPQPAPQGEDVAQEPEDGGLPPGLAAIVKPSAATIRPVPVTPAEATQFLEPARMSVDQIRSLIGRSSTSTAMLRTMLSDEEKSDRPRSTVVDMLTAKINAAEKR